MQRQPAMANDELNIPVSSQGSGYMVGDGVRRLRSMNRDGRIELLRIIAMLLIVICHFTIHMPWNLRGLPGAPGVISQFAVQNGQIGVVLFFLITGYFQTGRAFNLHGIMRTWLRTFLYSSMIFIAALVEAVGHALSLQGTGARLPEQVAAMLSSDGTSATRVVMEMLMPVLSGQYWFISAYILLLFFSPFLNMILEHATRGDLFALLCLLIFCSFLPLLGFTQTVPFKPVVYAVTCYLIGGYIKTYPDVLNQHNGLTFTAAALTSYTIIMMAFDWSISVQAPFATALHWGDDPVTLLNGFQVLLATVIFRRTVRTSREHGSKQSGLFCLLASGMFSVYLLHDNLAVRHVGFSLLSTLIAKPASPWTCLGLSWLLAVLIFIGFTCLALLLDTYIVNPLVGWLAPKLENALYSTRHHRIE
jgi:surface polysaccharide O-acyltransferase-like enzyme